MRILYLIIILISCQHSDKRIWTETDRQFLIEHLNSSIKDIQNETQNLTFAQWSFTEDTKRWSITEIIEHLFMHEIMYYRELSIHLNLPEREDIDQFVFDTDSTILSYQNITPSNQGPAPWYLQPSNNWKDPNDLLKRYVEFRKLMIDKVSTIQKNLRHYISPSGRGTTEYRDLHQVMLISIAHTRRHLKQIRRVKDLPDFPK